MTRRSQFAVGAGLAIVLLWFFLREADLGVVLTELRRADYRWVMLAVALTLLVTVQRGWRWHYLLLPVKNVRMSPLIACTFMGWVFTTLLPGRLGEIAKPVLLGRREGISKTAAFATVVLERLFDLMCILLMLVAYLLVFPLPSALDSEGAEVLTLMRASGFAALGALVVAVMFMAGAQRWPERTDILLTRVLGFVPGRAGDALVPVARCFLEGFAGLRDPKLFAIIAVHSILIWVNVIVTYWIMFLAFDIEAPYYAVLPLLVLVVIGVMVPTPAAVGAFHAAVRIALVTLWAVPNEQAVSYAILTHAMAFVPITVIGLALLSREGLTVTSLEGLEDSSAS